MSNAANETGAPVPTGAPAGRNEGDRPRLVAYVVLLLGSLGLFFVALQLPASRWEPLGAGTFPAIVLGLMMILCLVGIAQEARLGARARTGAGFVATVRSYRLVIFTFLAFAIYTFALPLFGFGLCTFVFLLVVQLGLAPRTWAARAIALVIAVVFSFGTERLFADLFGIFLPRASLF